MKDHRSTYFGMPNNHDWSSSWCNSKTGDEVVDVVKVEVGGRREYGSDSGCEDLKGGAPKGVRTGATGWSRDGEGSPCVNLLAERPQQARRI